MRQNRESTREVLRQLRTFSDAYVILVTARALSKIFELVRNPPLTTALG